MYECCIPLKTLVQVGGDTGEEHLTRVGGGGWRACVQLDICIKREREREGRIRRRVKVRKKEGRRKEEGRKARGGGRIGGGKRMGRGRTVKDWGEARGGGREWEEGE